MPKLNLENNKSLYGLLITIVTTVLTLKGCNIYIHYPNGNEKQVQTVVKETQTTTDTQHVVSPPPGTMVVPTTPEVKKGEPNIIGGYDCNKLEPLIAERLPNLPELTKEKLEAPSVIIPELINALTEQRKLFDEFQERVNQTIEKHNKLCNE